MTLVSQFNFYLAWVWSITNIERLGDDVKTGRLDLILTKPCRPCGGLPFKKI